MAASSHEVEITTGRRRSDGRVRLSVFAEELLTLTVEGYGERAPTLLLTLEQARNLRAALDELLSRVERTTARRDSAMAGGAGAWDGAERRSGYGAE